MKTDYKRIYIHNFPDLETYGISVLTGEACGYSLRLLCDLNEDGVKLLNDFFSVEIKFPENWNSRVGQKEAIASVMLPREIFVPLTIFILFHVEKMDMVLQYNGSFDFTGIMDDDEPYKKLAAEDSERVRTYTNMTKQSSQPTVNGRCVHAMSGRSL